MKSEEILSEVMKFFEDDTDDTGYYVKSFDDCTIDGGLNIKLKNIDVWYNPIEDLFELSINGNGRAITQFYGDWIDSLIIKKKNFVVYTDSFSIFCN